MSDSAGLPLEPLAYHSELVAFLKSKEPELWQWFSEERWSGEHDEETRLELLKATYRVERNSNPALYEIADDVAAALRISAPVTLYQAQMLGERDANQSNAALFYISRQAHLVFFGPVLTIMTPEELRSIVAHELAHFFLQDSWRDYRVAGQLLGALTNEEGHRSCYLASARLFQLYTEVFCDRTAYRITGNLGATVTGLIKLETGATDVSPESYFRQAAEVVAGGHDKSQGVTHPELYVRARALQQWAERPQSSESETRAIIEGIPALDDLDLLGQERVREATRQLIAAFLEHRWLHTDAVIAHARLFFDDILTSVGRAPAAPAEYTRGDAKLRDYYCYVLLDLAAADPELEDGPLAAALLLSNQHGLLDRFRELAAKELKIGVRNMKTLESNAQDTVSRAQKEMLGN